MSSLHGKVQKHLLLSFTDDKDIMLNKWCLEFPVLINSSFNSNNKDAVFFWMSDSMRGGGSVGSIVASQQDGPWFESRLSQDAFLCGVCMFFPCLRGFSPQSKDMLYRWFGQRKLAIVCVWMSECVLALGLHELVHSQGWVAWKGIRCKNEPNRLCGSLRCGDPW